METFVIDGFVYQMLPEVRADGVCAVIVGRVDWMPHGQKE